MGEVRNPDEFFDLAEKIIQNINTVFHKDSSLDEFDIVPVESQSNRSPVIHLSHKLALESWCVPFLYSHSFKCFIEILPKNRKRGNNNRSHHQQQQQTLGINNKNEASSGSASTRNGSSSSSTPGRSYSSSQLTEGDRMERKRNLSRILILLNPDLALAWNYRRDVIQQQSDEMAARVACNLVLLQQELSLVTLVASRKPKCSEVFTYRKWLLKQVLMDPSITPHLEEMFTREILAVSQAASNYFSNYHAWDYRRWLLETFLQQDSLCTSEVKLKILTVEKLSSDEWIERHISDHSGFHYRQRLLSQMSLFESDLIAVFGIFRKELESNLSLIRRYPGHETLWYHRRFLLQFIVPKLQMELTAADAFQNHSHQHHSFHHQPMEIDWESDDGHWKGKCSDTENNLEYLKKKEEDLVKSMVFNGGTTVENQDSRINFITKDSSILSVLHAQKHVKWLFMMFEWTVDNNN